MNVRKKSTYSKFNREILTSVIQYLHQQGVTFWFDHGSLLGLRREGKLLDWDLDVDFGALELPLPKKLSIVHYFYGRLGSCCFDSLNNAIKINLFDKDSGQNWTIDISFYEKKENILKKYWVQAKERSLSFRIICLAAEIFGGVRTRNSNYKSIGVIFNLLRPFFLPSLSVFLYETQRRRATFVENIVDAEYIFPLIEDFHYGAPAPNKIDAYLAYRYGEDWTTPKRQWDYLNDDGGIKKQIDA